MITELSATPARDLVLDVRDVSKVYGTGELAVQALRGVSLQARAGELVAVMGASGSGKSTLLQIAGGLERASAGTARIEGVELAELSPTALAAVRRCSSGFVFQSLNLISSLTAAENVALPLELAGVPHRKARERARTQLVEFDLLPCADRFPDELSGGQQQRIAIARALIGERRLVLADEPTGALDSVTGDDVLRLLRTRIDAGAAGVLVTHESRHAAWADRVVFLRDGLVVDDNDGTPVVRASAAMLSATAQAIWLVPLFVTDAVDPGDGPQLTVMTSNLSVGNGDASSVVELVRSRSVDVLAVQELTPDAVLRLYEAGLDCLLPYRRLDAHLGVTGNGLWTRFPFYGQRKSDDSSWPTLSARIQLPGRLATVVVTHPAAPSLFDHDSRDADFVSMRNTLRALSRLEGPVIVAGDFNATLDNKSLRNIVADGFVDAAEQSGSGVVMTWPAFGRVVRPFAGIDHILVRGDGLVATDVETAIVPRSDHKSLIAKYRLT